MARRDEGDEGAGTDRRGRAGGRKREETKRLGRVLKIATLLMSQPYQHTRARLATDYEVSERSIDRDLALLRGLSYELDHDREQGYAFVRTPPLPPVPLTLPDVLALTLAAELARDSGDIDTASLGAALARLFDAVPSAARPLLRRELLRRMEGKRAGAGRRLALATVQRALLEGRCVRIVYATASRGDEISDRVIEPYAVSPYDGSWMITAYDHRRSEVRDFKVDRIVSATLLDDTYEIPATFSMSAYRGLAWGVLRGETTAPTEITLLFDREAGRWVQEEGRTEEIAFEPQEDGCVLAHLVAGITPEFIRWIFWYGSHCRVVAPDSLREQVRAMAQDIAYYYTADSQDMMPQGALDADARTQVHL